MFQFPTSTRVGKKFFAELYKAANKEAYWDETEFMNCPYPKMIHWLTAKALAIRYHDRTIFVMSLENKFKNEIFTLSCSSQPCILTTYINA